MTPENGKKPRTLECAPRGANEDLRACISAGRITRAGFCRMRRMTLHIGIVGCSAEGAALCYKTICIEGAALLGPHAHPEVSMHTPSLAQYTRCLDAGDLA